MNQTDPNRNNLIAVAKKLEELCDQVVFVGGCTVGLLITDPLASEIRETQDVDVIVELASRQKYYDLFAQLRSKGFEEDVGSKILCRWKHRAHILDVMPANAEVLGFSNRWYVDAIENSSQIELDSCTKIRLVSAPYFIATKLEAFQGRGQNDLALSHDIEDVIAVIDGRKELVHEIEACDVKLKDYLSQEFQKLIKKNQLVQHLPGFVAGDTASQSRVPIIQQCIQKIIDMS